jgi:hypothetical protein
LLSGACDGDAPPFSGLARWGWGLWRLFFGWVVLGNPPLSWVVFVFGFLSCNVPAIFVCGGVLSIAVFFIRSASYLLDAWILLEFFAF